MVDWRCWDSNQRPLNLQSNIDMKRNNKFTGKFTFREWRLWYWLLKTVDVTAVETYNYHFYSPTNLRGLYQKTGVQWSSEVETSSRLTTISQPSWKINTIWTVQYESAKWHISSLVDDYGHISGDVFFFPHDFFVMSTSILSLKFKTLISRVAYLSIPFFFHSFHLAAISWLLLIQWTAIWSRPFEIGGNKHMWPDTSKWKISHSSHSEIELLKGENDCCIEFQIFTFEIHQPFIM